MSVRSAPSWAAQGRTLTVKGVKQVQKPVETLDARDLGRLINAADDPHRSDKRDMTLTNVVARGAARRWRSRMVISNWGRVLGCCW